MSSIHFHSDLYSHYVWIPILGWITQKLTVCFLAEDPRLANDEGLEHSLQLVIFNSLRHSSGPLGFGRQAKAGVV
jgi:hypothetical protein